MLKTLKEKIELTNMNIFAVLVWFLAGIACATAYFSWFIASGNCVIVR